LELICSTFNTFNIQNQPYLYLFFYYPSLILTGAAGAATGFARTFPMKGRASRVTRLARVRNSKSDYLARRADSRRFAVGFILMLPHTTNSFPNLTHPPSHPPLASFLQKLAQLRPPLKGRSAFTRQLLQHQSQDHTQNKSEHMTKEIDPLSIHQTRHIYSQDVQPRGPQHKHRR